MMPIHANSDRPVISASIRAAAAEWLVRREEGLAENEKTTLATWLEMDERHARAFAEVSRSSRLFDRLAVANDARSSFAPPRNRRAMTLVPWVAAAALVVGVLTWWQPINSARHVETVTTEIGGLQNLSLPDGSTVTLNTDSSVKVAFDSDERRIELVRGEAYFRVAKDARRPFVVTARQLRVRAVGTAFNVRLDSAAVEVLVTEGRVRLNDAVSGKRLLNQSADSAPATADADSVLGSGQRAVIRSFSTTAPAAPAMVEAVPPEEADRALAWQEQRLIFVSAPLRDVVAQFNRYNRHQLVIDDPRLNELRFGGRFRPNAYDAFVQLLEGSFEVSAERRSAQTFLRQKP